MDFSSIFTGILSSPLVSLFMLVLSLVFVVRALKLYSPVILGWIGEREVRTIMDTLDPTKYICFHNVLLPIDGETTQIDHIVFAGNTCFVIETKAHRGWIFGSAHDKSWTQMLGARSKFKFQNPMRQNYKHISAVKKFVDELSVIGVVVFTRGKFKNDRIDNVLYTGELKNFLINNAAVDSLNNDSAVQALMAAVIVERRAHKAHVRRLQVKYGGRWRIPVAHSLMVAAVCLLIFRPATGAIEKNVLPIIPSLGLVHTPPLVNRTTPGVNTPPSGKIVSRQAIHMKKSVESDERLFAPSVSGFMRGKVVVTLAKGFQVLRVGEVTNDGWTLVRADSNSATFLHASGTTAEVEIQ